MTRRLRQTTNGTMVKNRMGGCQNNNTILSVEYSREGSKAVFEFWACHVPVREHQALAFWGRGASLREHQAPGARRES